MNYYNKFLDFLRKNNLYNQKSFAFISYHTTNIDYNEETKDQIGYTYTKNNEDKIIDFKICVPTIEDEKTLIINIRNYIYALFLYEMLGKKEKIGEVQEAIALFYERLYILVEEFSIKEYNKFLAEEINERNDENFTKGAKLSIELLNYYDESIEKLTNRASAMTKKIK